MNMNIQEWKQNIPIQQKKNDTEIMSEFAKREYSNENLRYSTNAENISK